MTKTESLYRPKEQKQSKSLYDLGFFNTHDKRRLATTLKPLGISKNRPLFLADSSVVLQLNDRAVLLAFRSAPLGGPTNVICGWKEKNTDGKENYCLGIMDKQVTVAGEYYRCRRHPDIHRTLK